MVVLDFLGSLALLFAIGYLIYFIIMKVFKRNRTFSKKLFLSTFVGSLVLMAISMQFDTVSGAQYQEQVNLSKDLQDQVDTLHNELKSVKEELAQASTASQKIKEAEDKQVKAFEEEKKVLQEKQQQLQEQVATLQKDNEALTTQLANAQAANTSSSTSTVTTQTQEVSSSSSQNVYYKNCSQVRAAGAAPIYGGDPGYARHLDRDGDGVGCE